MEKILERITVSIDELLLYLILPTIVTGLLIYDKHYLVFKSIVNAFTALLIHVPSWSIPVVAPVSLLILFIGLPMLVELFKPRLGKILFSSLSLSFSILLIYFIKNFA